jgi:hypothetical protein
MLRGCSQLSQPDENACKMDEREERLGEFVVARGDASEMFETSEEAFDQIACPVEIAIERPWGETVGAGRNNRLSARGFNLSHEVIGVVPLVGNHGLSRQMFDQLGGVINVGKLSCRQNHPQRIAQGVDRDMEFGAQSAPRATNFLTPSFFLAPAECWCILSTGISSGT